MFDSQMVGFRINLASRPCCTRFGGSLRSFWATHWSGNMLTSTAFFRWLFSFFFRWKCTTCSSWLDLTWKMLSWLVGLCFNVQRNWQSHQFIIHENLKKFSCIFGRIYISFGSFLYAKFQWLFWPRVGQLVSEPKVAIHSLGLKQHMPFSRSLSISSMFPNVFFPNA